MRVHVSVRRVVSGDGGATDDADAGRVGHEVQGCLVVGRVVGQTGAGSTAGSVDRGVGKVMGCTPTGELSVCGTFSRGVTTIGYMAGLKRYAAGAYPGEERPLCACVGDPW